MRKGSLTPEILMRHREYFDASLIAVLEDLDARVRLLKSLLGKKESLLDAEREKSAELAAEARKAEKAARRLEKSLKEAGAELESARKELEIMRAGAADDASRISGLEKENSELRKRLEIYESKRQLKTDSTNSSTPPSQDPYRKRGSGRPKSGKARGGQKGHPAHVKRPEKPDTVIVIHANRAPSGAVRGTDGKGREYFAVQEISCSLETEVTEYRYYLDPEGQDPDKGMMKRHRISPAVYGPSVKALALYLSVRGAVALDRLSGMISEMSRGRIRVSPGTIAGWLSLFSALSAPELEKTAARLLDSFLLHADETGWTVSGLCEWLHAVTNGRDVLYFATDVRSGEDGPVGFLQGYEGILVHDHFSPYYTKLPDTITHVECNAHTDRERKRGIDIYGSQACRDQDRLMKEALERRNELKAEGKNSLPEHEITEMRGRYEKIITDELARYAAENPGVSAKAEADYIKMFRRMLKFEDEHLRFLTDFRIPYTNNTAERCMRAAKAKKKISGQSVSMKSAKDYANALSVIQTAIWSGENSLEKITEIFESQQK